MTGGGFRGNARDALSRGDLLHELSHIEWRLVGLDAELRELEREGRGDFDDLVHVGLFHPSGADLAEDIEQQGASAYGFDICFGTTGFLRRAEIDRDRRVIVRRSLSSRLSDEFPNREQIGGADWGRFPFPGFWGHR